MKNENIKWLQKWFYHNSKEKLLIETIDNPGWSLKLILENSIYKNKLFYDIRIDRTDDNWCHCIKNKKENIYFIVGGSFNLNEVISFFKNNLKEEKQSYRINVTENDLINRIQKWYFQYCDGDWEHSDRFIIKTMPDSTWYFSVLLEGTHSENKFLKSIEIIKAKSDWYKCYVEDGYFKGEGGSFNLINIINIFCNWVDKC
jgi:hypothetical protein